MAKKPWDTEDWKKAYGIKYNRGETNSALAERDYSIGCKTPSNNLIVIVKGYFVWWCSTHYQPLPWCERDIANLREKRDD